jgi:predicted amidohydrolase
MNEFRLALIQMNSKENDHRLNVEKAVEHVNRVCKSFRPDLVVLPEFFNTVYFPQFRDYKYLDYAETDKDYSITRMCEMAKSHGSYIIASIYELESIGLIFDTAVLIDDKGNIAGKYRKVHAAAVRSLEKIYFRPGSEFRVFRIRGWNVGILLCYDNYFPESARCLSVKGAELIVVPFATFEGNAPWEWLHRTRALENGCYLAACNKVGLEGEWVMGGKSMIIDPIGTVMKTASPNEDEILTAELDKTALSEARKAWPFTRDRRPDCYGDICETYEKVRGI